MSVTENFNSYNIFFNWAINVYFILYSTIFYFLENKTCTEFRIDLHIRKLLLYLPPNQKYIHIFKLWKFSDARFLFFLWKGGGYKNFVHTLKCSFIFLRETKYRRNLELVNIFDHFYHMYLKKMLVTKKFSIVKFAIKFRSYFIIQFHICKGD